MERGGYTVATTYASSYNIHRANFPKRNCNGRPFRLANFKKQLFRAWKVVFLFSPPDTLESRQWAFQVLFQLPKAQLQWETLPTGKFQKTTFQSLKSCFLILPRAGSELFRCVSAAQSVIAIRDPSSWQISKNNFSGPQKLFCWFSRPDTRDSRQWAFQVFFQLPKAQLQWETLPTGKFQKTTFQSLKSCFLLFPARKFSGVGKVCHRPTPGYMFEPAWSHKNRENSESWWNEAR